MKTSQFVWALALLAFPSTSLGYHDAVFTPLGELSGGSDGSNAHGVSGDGSVVVGDSYSSNGEEPFRWTATDGMVGLGGMPGGDGHAVSTDGMVVVGNSPSETYSPHAFRWTEEDGMVDLGFLPGGPGENNASSVSGDGTYIVGQADIPATGGRQHAFIWDEVNGMQRLWADYQSFAKDISFDGSVVVGSSIPSAGGNWEAFHWTNEGGRVGLSNLPSGDVRSYALGVSANGSVVVGYSNSANGNEAFRWTESGSMVGLGGLPSDNFESVAYAVSGDGYVVVGNSSNTPFAPNRAFVWTLNDGMLNLQDILINEYGLDLAGWQLEYAEDISDDGTTIVGRGINPDGYEEAWAVRLLLDRPPVDPILPGTDHRFEDHSGHDHNGTDLSNTDLRFTDLTSVNLNSANLNSAQLRLSLLVNADLRNLSVSQAITDTQLQSAESITGANLSGNDMSGFDLSNLNLQNVNLSGSNLASANLANAILASTDLTAANLNGADLRNPDASQAITDVQLRSATDVTDVNLSDNDLSGFDLSGLDLSGANVNGADFTDSDLSSSDLQNSSVTEAVTASQLRSAMDVTGVNLSGNDLSGFNLSSLTLSGANFDSSNLALTDFSGANLTDATLTTKILPTVNFSGSNLSGASLGDPTLFDGFIYDRNLDLADGTTTLNSLGLANLGAITTLSNATLIADNGVLLGAGDILVGNGQVDGKVTAVLGSVIRANGALTLGDDTSFAGFVSDGELHVGIHTVTLQDADRAVLGSLTEIGEGSEDGILSAPNGIQLGNGKTLVGRGVVNARVMQVSGSTIAATGNLTLGDSGSFTGFSSEGEMQIYSHTVTLHDRDKAILGSLTEIGSGGVGGTLSASNGILLEDGKVLVGQGTVNTDSDELKNEGLVQGDGTGITFNHLVTGDGSFGGDVTFQGGYTPGASPALIELENATFGSSNILTIQIGGRDKGAEYASLELSGTANLGGSLSGTLINLGGGMFVPMAGDSFEILTAAGGINGTFDEGGSLPLLTGDLYWDVVYDTENGRVLMDVLTPHTADFDGNGMVDGDDLGFWHDALVLFDHEEADADDDGDTDGADFLTWQRQVGSGVASLTLNVAVPEPSTLLLSLLSAVVIIHRCNRKCKSHIRKPDNSSG